MGPRWKGKGAETKANAEPISAIVSQLKASLTLSNSKGLLCGCSVLLEANTEQTDLLNRACIGRPIVTAEKNNNQWFQLSIEEAFYLCHCLRCLQIVSEDDCVKDDEQIWNHIIPVRKNFPYFFKAYSHLRMKNWVVRSGSQYGVDFVAYQHHPVLVHSEYAVLVSPDGGSGGGGGNGRLTVWSDYLCTLRLCGSVAKTLLILEIDTNGEDGTSLSCLERFGVDERTVTRWSPERCREDQVMTKNGIFLRSRRGGLGKADKN